MDPLRLSLLVIGIVVIASVFLLNRRSSSKRFLLRRLNPGVFLSSVYHRFFPPRQPQPPVLDEIVAEDSDQEWEPVFVPRMRAEPDIDDLGDLDVEVRALDPADQSSEQASGEELLIVLSIMAPPETPFTGSEISHAMEEAGLTFGELGIYHYFTNTPGDEKTMTQGKQPVCSVANAVEPGQFNPTTMATLTTPGLSLFMQLPGPLECRVAFDETLEIGGRLAAILDGELCDDSRSVLTAQSISHLREKIEAYLFKVRMADVKSRQH